MGIFKRIFGICETKPPKDSGCWKVSDNAVEIELERAPELSEKNGAIRIEGDGLFERILVLCDNDEEFHAFINKCTHAKRRIDPVGGESVIRCCSVGKATYNYNGEVISGSAKEPLKVLQIKKEDNRIIVSLD
ncbi:Rieske (2Fe-2S) protein [candidate division KSB1 bacterium]